VEDEFELKRCQSKKKKTANGRGGEPATNALEENLRPVTHRQTHRNQQQETTPEQKVNMREVKRLEMKCQEDNKTPVASLRQLR